MILGGIDVGGTAIKARIFTGEGFLPGVSRRWETPKESYPALIEHIAEAVEWLRIQADQSDLPIGLALAGLIDSETGESFAANTPATGQTVVRDLTQRVGVPVPVMNDCAAFALSEAQGGAGQGARSVVGLTFGTGLGAGHWVGGKSAFRHGGDSVEIGHIGISAQLAAFHELPGLKCGCGRTGCYEAYLSSAGLSALGRHILGRDISHSQIIDDPSSEEVLSIWFEVVAEALQVLYLMLAPNIIVLGGGVSQMPDFVIRARSALAPHVLGSLPLPKIAISRFGNESGARGAALYAGRMSRA
ncbi:MAG: ROK family protein [Boseongicola sp.]|nr:MAG: ROK family protein [Boseongicola sp.]